MSEIIRKIKVLVRYAKDIAWFILFLPFSLIILLLIRGVSSIVIIRLGWLVSWRIGHYAGNVDMYLCEQKKNYKKDVKILDIWCERTRSCNYYLTVVLKRAINIFPKLIVYPVYLLNNFIPGGEKHNIPSPACNDRDINNLIADVCQNSNVYMTDEEEERGRRGLMEMGVGEDDKFVCLIVRDAAYLEKQKQESYSGVDWSYHDYRDTDIDDYKLAAQYLAEQGFYVIRMGAVVEKPFIAESDRIIDYASNGMRSDFMDIYLGAKCHFCISTSTGYDAVPSLFRRPLVIVNNPHIEYVYSYFPKTVTIFKKVFDKHTREPLSIERILNEGIGRFDQTNQFVEKGVELIDNTPEEIKDAVEEMVLRLDDKWTDTWYEDNAKDMVNNLYQASKLNGRFLSKFGTKFLQDNTYLLK